MSVNSESAYAVPLARRDGREVSAQSAAADLGLGGLRDLGPIESVGKKCLDVVDGRRVMLPVGRATALSC